MTDPSPADRAWVEVDLAALLANARLVASRAQRPLLPMVKANGYGLGAVAVAEALLEVGPWGFGVATPEEARELRIAGVTKPIVCFSPLLPAWIPVLRALDVRPAIGDAAVLAAWQQAGGGPYHLELDSGMSRGGIRWDDGAGWAAALLAAGDDDDCEGLFSHCHSAETDAASVALQSARLAEVAAAFPRRPAFVHLANSAVALSHPAYAGDLARPGIALYGSGAYGAGGAIRPAPVARLAAHIVAVRLVRAGDTVSYGATWTARRDTRIATLAIGYADGVPRALSNRGSVELAGRVIPIVGRVTMDMTLVAVPDDLPVAPGDVATLFGRHITLDAQALAAGTIGYELLTALGSRVRRLYR